MTLSSSSLRDQLADGAVNLIAERGGLFDARAGGRAHVKLELAAIDRGKKSWPSIGIRANESKQQAKKQTAKSISMRECSDRAGRGSASRMCSKPCSNFAGTARAGCGDFLVASRAASVLAGEKVLRHRGDDRSRKKVRREHGEDHGFRERHEQVTRHAGQEKHRHEHDADATASKRTPARRFARRRREWPASISLP